MISTKENIEEYSELFKKYYAERIFKLNEYKKKHNIKDGETINSIDHPDYFEIDREWDKRRNALDEPILKNAKYKINQKLEFTKTNYWHYDFSKSSRTEKVLSYGIVTQIKTSGNGSGEILYCFDVLEPPCPESNPYCLENDVIRVLTATNIMQKINLKDLSLSDLISLKKYLSWCESNMEDTCDDSNERINFGKEFKIKRDALIIAIHSKIDNIDFTNNIN